MGVTRGRRTGTRRGPGATRRGRPELRRHVLPQRPLPRRPAGRDGRRRCRRRRGRGRGCHQRRRGRPGHLHGQPPGCLQHRADHVGGSPDPAPRVDPVRHRRRHDHARPDLGVPASPHRPAPRGRHRAAPRGRRRCRPHLHPVGAPAGHQRDRHRLHRREGGGGPGPRLRAHDHLHPRGRRDPRSRDHGRRRRAGRLRQHRPDDVPVSPSTPSPVVASWCASGPPPARFPRSTPWSSRSRARSS